MSDQQTAADLADALAEAEWFLAARSRRAGLTHYARALVARVNEVHSTPKEAGTDPSPVERADEGDPDSPESPQSHAEAPGRENTRDDGPEPGSVALVPAVTAPGGFGDGNPDATAPEQ